MNVKFIISIVLIVLTVVLIIISLSLINEKEEVTVTTINIDFNSGGSKILIKNPEITNLFQVYVYENDLRINENGFHETRHIQIEFNPQNTNLYNEIKINPEDKVVFIIPIFTELAYGENGFYSYYNGLCNESCLKVPIKTNIPLSYRSSENAVKTLKLLGYSYLTDIEVDKDPDILNNYNKVIILHNEYVTKKEFEAITNHPKVVYLYPNSLYAEITTDYSENTIRLVKGHGFPTSDVNNGFLWKFDNTRPYEFDITCINWKFMEITNGKMLNCFPENTIYRDFSMLKTIKEY